MRDELPKIRAKGAELLVVGNGTPTHARHFREDEGLTMPLLVDPEMKAYRAAGLRRDLASTLNVQVLGNALRALRRGHRQHRTAGDPWQQGGTFIIVPPETVAFAQVSQTAGDHPEPAALLEALQNATA